MRPRTQPIEEPERWLAKNRWWRGINRSPSVPTAASGFVLYLAGVVLLIGSVWMIIAGLLLAIGEMGSGWRGHLIGVVLIVGGVTALALGRWATCQYAVEGRG